MTRTVACLLVLLALTTAWLTAACSNAAPGSGSGSGASGSPAPGSGASGPAAPALGTNGAPVPVIAWRSCGTSFQCAGVRVPLDYRRPTGPTIDLAAIRMPATDPAHRIGTLVVNFGGPGSVATSDLRRLARRFDGVRARMDVLAVDPRGVGGSIPVRCGPPLNGAWAPAGSPLVDRDAFWASAATAGQVCAATAGETLGHLSTANTARDLDMVRQGLGEPEVSLYGYSYGTYTSATYANLFPDHTRAMVVDGTLDIVANAGGPDAPIDIRDGIPAARDEEIAAFADACAAAGPARCALAPGTGEEIRGRIADVFAAAARTPSAADLSERLDDAFSLPSGLRGFARTLAASPTVPSGGVVPPTLVPWVPQHAADYLAIQCTDTVTPDAATMDAVIAREQVAHPITAATAALNIAGCVGWPAIDPDRYLGPWNAPLRAPALVVNDRYDPKTPMVNAQHTASALSAARILTVDGFGHTTLNAPSRCASDAATAYLLDPTVLPPEGTVCPQDAPTFG